MWQRGFLSYATALSAASLRPALRRESASARPAPASLRVSATCPPSFWRRSGSALVRCRNRVSEVCRSPISWSAATRIQKLEPAARKAVGLDRQINITRNRAQTLDNFRLHTKDDLDALSELTKLLPPPAWVNSFQLTRYGLVISGEAEQAAPLIKLMDGSRSFGLGLRHSDRQER